MIQSVLYLIDFEKGLAVLRKEREALRWLVLTRTCSPLNFEYLDWKIHVDSNLQKNYEDCHTLS